MRDHFLLGSFPAEAETTAAASHEVAAGSLGNQDAAFRTLCVTILAHFV